MTPFNYRLVVQCLKPKTWKNGKQVKIRAWFHMCDCNFQMEQNECPTGLYVRRWEGCPKHTWIHIRICMSHIWKRHLPKWANDPRSALAWHENMLAAGVRQLIFQALDPHCILLWHIVFPLVTVSCHVPPYSWWPPRCGLVFPCEFILQGVQKVF